MALSALQPGTPAFAAEQRLMVRHLEFVGNQNIEDLTLRTSIATSRSSAWRRDWFLRWVPFPFGEQRFVNDAELRRDVLRLQLLYRRSGFPDVRVDTLMQRGSDWVDIRFVIDEGQPVRVTSLSVSGTEGIIPSRDMMQRLPLDIGAPFDRLLFLAAADSIRSMLRNRGYPFAEVFRFFDENRFEHVATVRYQVDPGPLAIISSIEVDGPGDIDEALVTRTLPFREGQLYSREAILEGQRDLYRLGVYDFVNVTLTDSIYDQPSDSLVTIRVQVSEGRLHRLRAGAGYGTLDCFRGLASYTVRNFLGGGRSLEMSARVSKIGSGPPFDVGLESAFICRQLAGNDTPEDEERRELNYNLTSSLTFPYVFSPNNVATFSVTLEKRSEVNAYLREALSGAVALTRQTGFDVPVTASYSLSVGETKADAATLCTLLNICSEQDRQRANLRQRQSTFGLGLARNRTNSPINPSRGNRWSADLRMSDEMWGSDSTAQFVKWNTEFASYHRIGRRSTLAWRVRLGAVHQPLSGAPGGGIEYIPTEERFFLGGPNSVRGYPQNQLGPIVRVLDYVPQSDGTIRIDTLISPTGASRVALANVEMRFPLLGSRIAGAAFVDAGDAFEAGNPFRLLVTPGFGVRFLTPIGPIRLDLAYNLADPEPGRLFVLQGNDVVPHPDYGDTIFQPAAPDNFLGRLQLNFAIGEAF
jgi:outer membrane protein assembly factor BamA